MSMMTIARSRQQVGATLVQNIQDQRHATEPLTVHWDRKQSTNSII